MKKIFKLLIIFIFILITSLFISCKSEKIIDSFTFELNESEKISYIDKIGKTTNDTIVYKIDEKNAQIIIKYTFVNNETTKKEIYSFYKSIESFRSALMDHVDYLDGYYQEVCENILLIKTIYDYIDSATYNTLYEIIKENYEII